MYNLAYPPFPSLPSNSHHQDYYMFTIGFRTRLNLHLPLFLRQEKNPMYNPYCHLLDCDSFDIPETAWWPPRCDLRPAFPKLPLSTAALDIGPFQAKKKKRSWTGGWVLGGVFQGGRVGEILFQPKELRVKKKPTVQSKQQVCQVKYHCKGGGMPTFWGKFPGLPAWNPPRTILEVQVFEGGADRWWECF